MIDGLDDTCPTSYRPEAMMATPSMLGPPGWIAKSMPFLLVEAHALGDHLADLVAPDDPAQLHVDARLALREGVDAEQAAGGESAGDEGRLQQTSATGVPEMGHGEFLWDAMR
jgi:hypothetical protein